MYWNHFDSSLNRKGCVKKKRDTRTGGREGYKRLSLERKGFKFCKVKHRQPQILFPDPKYQNKACQDSLPRLQLTTQGHWKGTPPKGPLHTKISYKGLLSLTLNSLLLLHFTSCNNLSSFFLISFPFSSKVQKSYFWMWIDSRCK